MGGVSAAKITDFQEIAATCVQELTNGKPPTDVKHLVDLMKQQLRDRLVSEARLRWIAGEDVE